MEEKSKRDEVIEVVNKLFIYTDHQKWDNLLAEVFTASVKFDMSSVGGGDPRDLQASEICDMWKAGFEDIDAAHHQAGNYLVKFSEGVNAHVFCYARAQHYKASATQGQIREFVGTYDIQLVLTDIGWRINAFKFSLKFLNGNTTLE